MPYSYVPVETKLASPIQLTAADYGQIGTAALNAANMLMKSPLNPAVRADMQASIARSKAQVDLLKSGGPELRGISGGELTVTPQVAGGPGEYTKHPGFDIPPGKEPPPAPDQTTANKATGDKPPPAPQPMNGNLNPAATLAPPNTFQLNPSAGYFPTPGESSSTSLFNTPSSTSAPPAPDQAVPKGPPAAISQAAPPAQQGGANTPLLASWQASQAHPVLASGDALDWAKKFDTGAQRATYLPIGGPGGEPAYAFHMKGGGVNTVPISQMVRNGAGPAIAGQSTSAVLSATEAQEQANRPSPLLAAAPPATAPAAPSQIQPQVSTASPQVATAQPVPPVTTQPGGAQVAAVTPSPVPNPNMDQSQLSDEELQRRIAQATNVASQGGPSASTLTASTEKGVPQTYHANNPSGAVASNDISKAPPPPPGAVPGQADKGVSAANDQAATSGYQNYPRGPNGSYLVSPPGEGLRWYSDPTTSGTPYLIYGSTPWSEFRMYNDGKWDIHEYPIKDSAINKYIMDKTGQDASNWSQEQKIAAARSQYYLDTHEPMNDGTRNRLQSLHDQVVYAQRLKDGLAQLPADQRGAFRQIQNNMAAHQYDAVGTPVDQLFQNAVKTVAPNGVDPRLQHVLAYYHSLMGGAKDENLTGDERGQLANLKLDSTLDSTTQDVYKSRIGAFNRGVNQAMANNQRISPDWLTDANSISVNHRIPDGGSYFDPAKQPAPQGAASASATPAPATTVRVPPGNSRQAPMLIDTPDQRTGEALIRQLPHHTWVKDKFGHVMQVP